jgi:hypothetical protein
MMDFECKGSAIALNFAVDTLLRKNAQSFVDSGARHHFGCFVHEALEEIGFKASQIECL